MKIVLIGHRGCGKSSVLKRWSVYAAMEKQKTRFFDLDQEIESREGRKIQNIFDRQGEQSFRNLEKKYFSEIFNQHSDFVIALGAGFDLNAIELVKDLEVVWIRRALDSEPRIFLDRPRLLKNLSPQAEYAVKFSQRDPQFRQWASWVYQVPEGLQAPHEIERRILQNQIRSLGGCLTLTQSHLAHWASFEIRGLRWGYDLFELRNDLLSESQIFGLAKKIPHSKILFSIRKANISHELLHFLKFEKLKVDWDLVLGNSSFDHPHVLSTHQNEISSEFLEAQPHRHLKLSPAEVSWEVAEKMIDWQAQDHLQRSFLPRSNDGRWNWLRRYLKGRQKINFINDGFSDVLDQPTLFEWLATPYDTKNWAAVLGNPVVHSFSPVEHESFFRARKSPFFRVQLQKEDWDQGIRLFKKLGLKWAAVTSPLKNCAYQFSNSHSLRVKKLESANSLFICETRNQAENTDIVGLAESLQSQNIDLTSVVVWGGGGVLSTIKEILPDAIFKSARDASIAELTIDVCPSVLIWAGSPTSELPPVEWKPKQVFDLNYVQHSRAREYALLVGAKYVSGYRMFIEQAEGQQVFWKEQEV